MARRTTKAAGEATAPVVEEVSEKQIYRFLVASDYRFNTAQVAGVGFSKSVPVEVNASFLGLPELLSSAVLVQYD